MDDEIGTCAIERVEWYAPTGSYSLEVAGGGQRARQGEVDKISKLKARDLRGRGCAEIIMVKLYDINWESTK
jgi:hypothetical protein